MRTFAVIAAILLGGGVLMVAVALYLSVARPAGEATVTASTLLEDIIDQLTAPLGRQGRATRTAEALSRANIDLRPQEWYAIRIAVPVVTFIVLSVIQPFFGVAVLGAVLAFFAPGLVLRSRRNHRRQELLRQLPETLQIMASSLEAGGTVLEAIQAVGNGLRPPMGLEFSRVDREVKLGIPLDEALDRVVARVDSRDLAMVVSAIQINRQMGGSLAAVLDTVSGTMRARARLKDRVRVLTAQVRLSTRVISVIPFALAAILLLIAPRYMAPLFTTTIGYAAISLGFVMAAIAYFVMANIANIEI
jgi:tight adherence protein B